MTCDVEKWCYSEAKKTMMYSHALEMWMFASVCITEIWLQFMVEPMFFASFFSTLSTGLLITIDRFIDDKLLYVFWLGKYFECLNERFWYCNEFGVSHARNVWSLIHSSTHSFMHSVQCTHSVRVWNLTRSQPVSQMRPHTTGYQPTLCHTLSHVICIG